MNDPWEHHAKTPKDLLVDIMLDLPSLYQGIDEMKDRDRSITGLREELQQLASKTTGRLLQWGSEFATAVVSPRSDWQVPSNLTTDNIASAHLMTLYWASLMIAQNVYHIVFDEESDVVGIDLNDCCRNIIRCIPLFLHQSTGIFRQHLMPFPAMTAIRHLKSTRPPILKPEREFVLSLSENTEFAGMRQFMLSVQPQLLTGLE
ncbi:uncharacterized protein N7482_009270 [Penicillium canariense]|uniref:Uncharacterized protein n=1 Tax=Penicillium canariense TaxID=189055 RepID=A0A9W9HNT8_9EURO|nr:uncharacterized protein N7482_009270 [Penicillium canariense]KAJ5152792.1 hypothetical protein N7482_009270 [Penicillium canariense]